ncbi:MAG: hypothetical protein ACJ8G7_02080 [Rhizobacter sp.]
MNSLSNGCSRLVAFAPVVVLVPLLVACAPVTPELDARFGDASRQLRAQQLIDPNAPTRNGSARAKADGRSVHEASERYIDSFKAPPEPTVINIGGVGR